MPNLTVEQALDLAVQHHRAGQLPEAENLYRQILAHQPDQPDAVHLLGVLAHQAGRYDIAVELIRRALVLKPNWAEAHSNLGNALKDQGELDHAIAEYHHAIALTPGYHEVFNNLGNALKKKGQLDDAVTAYRQAISLRPDYADAHGNLGNVLRESGEIDQAIAEYRLAISLLPTYAEAYSNLGDALRAKGQLDEAIEAFQQSIALKPQFAEAHANLGNALRDKEQLDQAIAAFRQAIAIRPNFAAAHSNLGDALREKGSIDEAIACCRQAIFLNPKLPEAHNNLGNSLRDKGQFHDAVAAFHQSIHLNPTDGKTHRNLGNTLRDLGELDDAIAAYREAIKHDPGDADAYGNLGNPLKDKGDIEQAIAAYRQAISLDPNAARLGSNLIFAMHHHADCDVQTLAEEHRRWNDQYAEPLVNLIQPHSNDPAPNRRLRVGYISPDFRYHVVGRSLMPLFTQHNHEQFEIFCYSKVINPDAMTAQLRQLADCWRNIVGLSDEQVAARIRDDRIDILVDLALHTAANSLPVFARKPAPVQVSYLGYCGTSGLRTMDYRFSDHFLDPPGTDLSLYSEKTVFLEPSYWCYSPNLNSPAPSRVAANSESITFGCLNNFSKVSHATLDVWAQILLAVPNSKLLVHALQGSHRQTNIDRFALAGVEANRIEFIGGQSFVDYLRTYNRIDISLDPFPYTGGITTCDSLWMGTPVVTLAGKQSPMSRGGCSVLANVGLKEFIASDINEYILIAIRESSDQSRLSELKRTLRRQMEQSPLMDARGFTKNIEAAYRQMWHHWCGVMAI